MNKIFIFAQKKGYYKDWFLSVQLEKVVKEFEKNNKNIALYMAIKNDSSKIIKINILKEKIVW